MDENKTLIQLLNEYHAIAFEILSNAGDSVSEASAEALDGAVKSLCEKADSYGHVMASLKLFQEQCAQRKEEWMKGERTAKSSIEALKSRMRYVLSELPDQSLSGSEYRFFLTKPSSRVKIDETALPKEFMKAQISYVPDREKIEKAVADGASIAGVTIEASQQLREGRAK